MLWQLDNPSWMQDECQEQGQQQQHAPPPTTGPGMILAQGQEEQNLMAQAAATAGNMRFRTHGMLDNDWYLDGMAAGAGAGASAAAGTQLSLLPAQPAQAGGSTFTSAGSQMFSPFNMGTAGPFDLHEFDIGLSDRGGNDVDLSSIVGNASNSSSLSLIPSGNAGSLGSFGGFATAPMQMQELSSFGGFDVFNNGPGSSSMPPPASASLTTPLAARSKAVLLRPLEIIPPVDAQPLLFEKRAVRRNTGEEEHDKKHKAAVSVGVSSGDDTLLLDDGGDDGLRIDASRLNYDSEDIKGIEESDKKNTKDANANTNSTVTAGCTGDSKCRKKSLQAKNLMSERRRRKKLNDRLFMLRSAVPRISKMDRASIISDAIEHLKELTQKSSDLQNELASFPPTASPLPPTPTSFHPLTPMPPSLLSRVKEELCPTTLPVPGPTAQHPSIEVGITEGRVVNIHMFCTRRPGLLMSAMSAIEGLGLDVQEAVFSCFNSFSMDIFKAELRREGPGLLSEEIKAVLLHSAGLRGVA